MACPKNKWLRNIFEVIAGPRKKKASSKTERASAMEPGAISEQVPDQIQGHWAHPMMCFSIFGLEIPELVPSGHQTKNQTWAGDALKGRSE